jgi:1-acyl-sn-glycerol-3-phosphate acyltransferase
VPSLFTSALPVNERIRANVDRLELGFSKHGIDAYGIDKDELARFFTALEWAYRHYFQVEVHGTEHIPLSGRAMLIGNHSGGVALDALMVLASCFFELDPPRLAQGMAEKFINKVPGASQMASRLGQFTGLPEHADRLLRDERLLMVFPEGARGTAKLARDADSLVRFGTGFMRLALKTRTPIIPVAFVGGGEAIPTVMNLYKLGQLLGVPYIPVTPYLVPFPKPVRLQLLYSEPLLFEGDGSEADDVIHSYVEQVRARIAWLIEQARALRAGTLKPEELELR